MMVGGSRTCTWPVLRKGAEQACGARTAPGERRCRKHLDRRPLVERTLDPLGPYVRAVAEIEARRRS